MISSARPAGQVVYRPVSVSRRNPLQEWYQRRPVEQAAVFGSLIVAVLLLSALFGWWGGLLAGTAALSVSLLVILAYAAVIFRRAGVVRAWERVRLPDPEYQIYAQVVAEVSSLRRGLVRLYDSLEAEVEDVLAERAWRVAQQLQVHGEVRTTMPAGPSPGHLADLDGKLATLREKEMAAVMEAIHIELDRMRDARSELDAWERLAGRVDADRDNLQWESLMNRLRVLNLGLRELDRLGLLASRRPRDDGSA